MKRLEERMTTGVGTTYRYYCPSCANYVYELESIGDESDYCTECTVVSESATKDKIKPKKAAPKKQPKTKKGK